MNNEQILKQRLISQILSINNTTILEQVEQFILKHYATPAHYPNKELTEEQLEMLRLAEEDIKYGRLTTQEALDKRNLKWLNEL